MNSIMQVIPCDFHIPHALRDIIEILHSKGFSAYLVGGCVRDGLLKKAIKDYDIATCALPNEIMEIFHTSAFSPIPIGIKFGTIALYHKQSKQQYEVTTFRTESAYNDNRKPDSVEFVDDLKKDLLRRDFSINALACEVRGKHCFVIDYVGGLRDLKKQKIVCVGNAKQRLSEDALRILRALRFSATLGFRIQKHTHNALVQNTPLLLNLSAQRIASELDKIFIAKHFVRVFKAYSDIFAFILHTYCRIDTLKNVKIQAISKDLSRFKNVKQDILLSARWVCILAFVQKHQNACAKQILENLKYPNAFIRKIVAFAQFYEVDLTPKRDKQLRIALKNLLHKMGVKNTSEFLCIKMCLMKKKHIMRVKSAFSVARKECFNLQGLCVRGDDLSALGLNGRQIGAALEQLLLEVINQKCKNTKKSLLSRAKKLQESGVI